MDDLLNNDVVRIILIVLLALLFLWFLFKFLLDWAKDKMLKMGGSTGSMSSGSTATRSAASSTTPTRASSSTSTRSASTSTRSASTATATRSSTPARKPRAVKEDLTKVEGIGPKINELLNKDGIYSFADLAKATPTRLNGVLDKAGPRFQMHDPATWPQQAALAARGDWTGLEALQDRLDAGRR